MYLLEAGIVRVLPSKGTVVECEHVFVIQRGENSGLDRLSVQQSHLLLRDAGDEDLERDRSGVHFDQGLPKF